MRSITPVVAIIVLLLMTVSAAGMAFLTISSYQEQAQEGTQGGIESIGSKTRAQLKIESVSDGQIYLRNLGQETFSNPAFYVEGEPLNVSGPPECESGELCVYTVLESVDCEGDCELSMGADAPVGTSMNVDEEQVSAYCGDDNCNPGEDCSTCPQDCGACQYSLSTFSDSSSSRNVTFSNLGSDASVKIEIPANSTILDATMNLQGYYVVNFDSSANSTIDGEGGGRLGQYGFEAGDINGDGDLDLIIGDNTYNSNQGRVYLLWGNGTGQFGLGNSYTIYGDTTSDFLGDFVCTEDVNKDGYDDLMSGGHGYGSGETGRGFIFWGNDTNDFANTNNYTFYGDSAAQFAWHGTSGDVNMDTYPDILLSSPSYNGNRGRLFIFWGNQSQYVTNADNFTLDGVFAEERLAQNKLVYDINLDTYPDLFLGAAGYNSWQGRVYIFWGNGSGYFNPASNYSITGENTNDWFGTETDVADINGDSYPDLIVGSQYYGTNAGRAYVFWGNSTGEYDAARNHTLYAEGNENLFSASMTQADLNEDGYDDLVVGALKYNSEQGRVYIFWGNATNDFTQANNYTMTGETIPSYFGTYISNADIDEDGIADILISSSRYNSDQGRAYIFYPTKNFTTSPYLYPGTNQSSSWNYAGSFSTTQTANMTDELNSILPDCTCQGCSLSGGNCTIDLNITSQSMGRIQLSNLQITYT